jgi:hypothetical protein
MISSRSLAAAALLLAILACGLGGLAWWESRRDDRPESQRSANSTPAKTDWLAGAPDAQFAQVEKHLRGLDVAMAEIGYRYGELLIASRERNWEYAQYQAEKIDLALRLALERRPKRAKSSQPFLNQDLPAVQSAIRVRQPEKLDAALEQLHSSCITCHQSESVPHFQKAVERIRKAALQ